MNLKWIFIAIFLACSGYFSLAQCELEEEEQTCVDVNLSLNANCMGELLPEMVIPALETMDEECAENYEITITKGSGIEIENDFGMDDLHRTYHYLIENDEIDFACSGKVTIEYKLEPQLICDPDTMFSCFTLEGYEGPQAFDDQCVDVIVRVIDEQINTMECEPGGDTIAIITRIYLAINEHGLVSDSCEQEIALKRFNIMTDIDWPDDMTIYDDDGCLEIPEPVGELVPKTIIGLDDLEEQICLYPVPHSLCNIKIDYEDLITNKKNCFIEIIREWTAYEWYCGEEFMATHIQTFEYMDNTPPDVTCDFGPIVAYAELDQCYAIVELPEIISQDTCNGIEKVDIKYPGGFIGNVMGDTSAHIPVGEHIITYRVYDVCHNMTTCDVMVTVLDTIQPLSLCKGPLVVDMENQMTIELDAEEFNLWSLDNCEIDSFAVARMEDNCNTPEDLEFNEDVLFCCQDTGQVVMVIMRTIDTSGNYSQCMVPVSVINGDCPPMLTSQISGLVYSADKSRIESAEVHLSGETESMTFTDTDGQYQFTGVPQNGNYLVEVHKADEILKGVSTLDLLLIQKHILGAKILDNPYSKIAADVNGDRTISSADIIELRQLILGWRKTLSGKESWSFVPADFEFQENRAAFIDEYPENYPIQDLLDDMEIDFIGVKTGDVSGDAYLNTSSTVKTKNNGQQFVYLEYRPEDLYIFVSMKAGFSGVIQGFQFAFDHPSLKLVSFSTGKVDLSASHISGITGNALTVSWHSEQPKMISPDDLLLSFVFQAKKGSINLNNLLELNNSVISPEIYLGEEPETFSIQFVDTRTIDEHPLFIVDGLQPNPWSDKSEVRLLVREEGNLRVRISDVLGRITTDQSTWLNKGHHTIQFDRQMIPRAGVYYVEWIFEEYRSVQKILVIN